MPRFFVKWRRHSFVSTSLRCVLASLSICISLHFTSYACKTAPSSCPSEVSNVAYSAISLVATANASSSQGLAGSSLVIVVCPCCPPLRHFVAMLTRTICTFASPMTLGSTYSTWPIPQWRSWRRTPISACCRRYMITGLTKRGFALGYVLSAPTPAIESISKPYMG